MKRLSRNSAELISLKDAVKYLPKRGGKKVHYSTMYRWATKGARGRVLETTMVGGIRYTSIAALQQFIGDAVHSVPEEADDLTAAIERALDEAGL